MILKYKRKILILHGACKTAPNHPSLTLSVHLAGKFYSDVFIFHNVNQSIKTRLIINHISDTTPPPTCNLMIQPPQPSKGHNDYTPPGWDLYCSPCRLYGATNMSSPQIPGGGHVAGQARKLFR